MSEYLDTALPALREALESGPLAGHAAALLPRALPEVRLHRAPGEPADRPGSSKLFGDPDLPPGTPWPCDAHGSPLRFVAQVDLAEVAPLTDDLPATGLLSLFAADPRPSDVRPGEWAVLHLPETAGLVRVSAPEGLEDLDLTEVAVRPRVMATVPRQGDDYRPPVALKRAEERALLTICQGRRDALSGTDRLLGHPDPVQLGLLEEVALYGKHRFRMPRDKQRWRLLAQVAVGGVHTVYWLVPSEDLPRLRLDRVVAIRQLG